MAVTTFPNSVLVRPSPRILIELWLDSSFPLRLGTTAATAAKLGVGPWCVSTDDVPSPFLLPHKKTYTDEVMADAPSGYWRCGEAAGATVFADSSGIATINDMSISGGPTLGVTGPLDGDRATGFTSLASSGAGGTASDVAKMRIQDIFTIACWVKLGSAPASVLTLFRGAQTTVSPRLYIFTDGTVRVQPWSVGADILTSNQSVIDNKWHHIVYRKSGTDQGLFIDGINRTFTIPGNQVFAEGAGQHLIGTSSVTLNYSMAEVAVYVGEALSVERIQAHYRAAQFYAQALFERRLVQEPQLQLLLPDALTGVQESPQISFTLDNTDGAFTPYFYGARDMRGKHVVVHVYDPRSGGLRERAFDGKIAAWTGDLRTIAITATALEEDRRAQRVPADLVTLRDFPAAPATGLGLSVPIGQGFCAQMAGRLVRVPTDATAAEDVYDYVFLKGTAQIDAIYVNGTPISLAPSNALLPFDTDLVTVLPRTYRVRGRYVTAVRFAYNPGNVPITADLQRIYRDIDDATYTDHQFAGNFRSTLPFLNLPTRTRRFSWLTPGPDAVPANYIDGNPVPDARALVAGPTGINLGGVLLAEDQSLSIAAPKLTEKRDWTVEFWFYPDIEAIGLGWRRICSSPGHDLNTGNNEYGWAIEGNLPGATASAADPQLGNLRLIVGDGFVGGTPQNSTVYTFPGFDGDIRFCPDRWHQIALTYVAATGTLRVFLDGDETYVATGYQTSPNLVYYNSYVPLRFGATANTIPTTRLGLPGRVGPVRTSLVARSLLEIREAWALMRRGLGTWAKEVYGDLGLVPHPGLVYAVDREVQYPTYDDAVLQTSDGEGIHCDGAIATEATFGSVQDALFPLRGLRQLPLPGGGIGLQVDRPAWLDYTQEVLKLGPLGYWSPEETLRGRNDTDGTHSISIWPDLSGYDGTLTLASGTDAAIAIVTGIGGGAGLTRRAWSFETGGASLSTQSGRAGLHTLVGRQEFSMVAWIYRASAPGSAVGILSLTAPSGPALWWRMTTGGALQFVADASTTLGLTTGSIADAAWHHVAVTVAGKVLRCWIDGIEQTLTGTSLVAWPASELTFLLGDDPGTGTFNGRIGDVFLVPYALSAQQILDNKLAGDRHGQTFVAATFGHGNQWNNIRRIASRGRQSTAEAIQAVVPQYRYTGQDQPTAVLGPYPGLAMGRQAEALALPFVGADRTADLAAQYRVAKIIAHDDAITLDVGSEAQLIDPGDRVQLEIPAHAISTSYVVERVTGTLPEVTLEMSPATDAIFTTTYPNWVSFVRGKEPKTPSLYWALDTLGTIYDTPPDLPQDLSGHGRHAVRYSESGVLLQEPGAIPAEQVAAMRFIDNGQTTGFGWIEGPADAYLSMSNKMDFLVSCFFRPGVVPSTSRLLVSKWQFVSSSSQGWELGVSPVGYFFRRGNGTSMSTVISASPPISGSWTMLLAESRANSGGIPQLGLYTEAQGGAMTVATPVASNQSLPITQSPLVLGAQIDPTSAAGGKRLPIDGTLQHLHIWTRWRLGSVFSWQSLLNTARAFPAPPSLLAADAVLDGLTSAPELRATWDGGVFNIYLNLLLPTLRTFVPVGNASGLGMGWGSVNTTPRALLQWQCVSLPHDDDLTYIQATRGVSETVPVAWMYFDFGDLSVLPPEAMGGKVQIRVRKKDVAISGAMLLYATAWRANAEFLGLVPQAVNSSSYNEESLTIEDNGNTPWEILPAQLGLWDMTTLRNTRYFGVRLKANGTGTCTSRITTMALDVTTYVASQRLRGYRLLLWRRVPGASGETAPPILSDTPHMLTDSLMGIADPAAPSTTYLYWWALLDPFGRPSNIQGPVTVAT